MNLYPYQQDGAAFLVGAPAKGALLADEPGLGKTRQALKACYEYLLDDVWAEPNVRVICPASAVGVWMKEIKGAPRVLAQTFTVESFNKAGADPSPFTVLIIDEAHYLKTRDSQRTIALFGPKCDGKGGLVERAERVILLTGTPTPNNPSEIWPLARACFPEAIMQNFADGTSKPMAYWPFVKRYCTAKVDYLGHIKITGGKKIDELRARLAPYVMRRLKKDVLQDLPEVRFDLLPVSATYRAADTEAEIRIRRALEQDGVAGLHRVEPHVASLRRVTGLAKVAGVMDWVEDWFEGGGGKLVLFAHHKEVIGALLTALRRAKIGCVVVDGSVRPADREKCATAFNLTPEIKVFVGQNEAAGTAITLTGASTLLSLEPAWTPGVNDQIWQRIHRIGQDRGCQVYYPTIAGSIDEDVQRALLPKQGAIDALWN